MSRQEFPAKVKDQAFARSKGICEKRGCGLPLQVGKFIYDHILPDALGGKPVLANCQVICRACDKIKTGKEDIPRIRKADRQRRAHIDAKVATKEIPGRDFPLSSKPKREPRPSLPPRELYR